MNVYDPKHSISQLKTAEINKFRILVLAFYKKFGRIFPWRQTADPYKILVSEIMLQQTQADRVVPKYEAFIAKFPTASHLAKAKLSDVLKLWKGLGYNRRAKYLQQAAHTITYEHKGIVPNTYEELLKIPGVGPATAGDILAFSFNIPTTVLETNIETALIHHFFGPHHTNIPKKILTELAALTVDKKQPRIWYYALMDYGAHIKKTVGNASRRAATYKKQSSFIGSSRQIRARILFLIHEHTTLTLKSLSKIYTETYPDSKIDSEILEKLLGALEHDGLIEQKNRTWYIRE